MLLSQVRGIDAWALAHHEPDAGDATASSREQRLDLARRNDVVQRQRRALIDRTAQHLCESVRLLRVFAATRLVLAHRNDWLKGKVADGVQAGGVAVVADLDNGADTVGVVVAEQPDLLLIEDKLPMVSGMDVLASVRTYAPGTVVVVQVESEAEIGPFLAAGATTAYTRRVPPAEIAAGLLELLARPGARTGSSDVSAKQQA